MEKLSSGLYLSRRQLLRLAGIASVDLFITSSRGGVPLPLRGILQSGEFETWGEFPSGLEPNPAVTLTNLVYLPADVRPSGGKTTVAGVFNAGDTYDDLHPEHLRLNADPKEWREIKTAVERGQKTLLVVEIPGGDNPSFDAWQKYITTIAREL